MPFDYMASPFEIDHSETGGTCGDNSEFQEDDIPSLLPSESEDPGQDSDVEVVKSRPQRSPYASDIIALRFSPSQTLRIPRQFLEKTPLATRLVRCHPPNEIDLGSIQFEAGHVIVNFLVTGKYQCLEPWGTTAAGKNSSEFRTALRVYMAAESFCLTELFDVAQAEVKKVGDRLSFPQVVDNVHFLNPFHAHFPWIGEYIQSRMVSFWESTTVEQATEMTSDVPGPSNLHKILINGLLKMKASSNWPRGRESTIRDTKGPEDRVEEDLVFPSQLVEKLRNANERMFKLAADLKTAGVLRSGSSNSPKKPERRRIQLPQFTLLQETPDLPPNKSVKEVEQEAVLEQDELRSLKSKIMDREKANLGFSWVDQRRLELLEKKSQRKADVLNAKRDWDRIDSQQEKTEAAFKNAISIEGMFHEVWRDDSTNLAKTIFLLALRKKHQTEKLEAIAKRKAAVERYQSPTSEVDQGHHSDTVASLGSSYSSLSTGQKTPGSDDGSSIGELCLELESHLSVGSWRGCSSCRRFLMQTIQDMVTLPELEVSED